MLRLLIGTGALLMIVGFGAAGWQLWQGLPEDGQAELADADPDGGPQSWLISASGGVVAPDVALAYLAQDRFVPARMASITRTAPLTDLLTDGETLPEAPYLQALADIRAPKVAEGLCKVLVSFMAANCEVNLARVVEGSVDPLHSTAEFQVDLAYRLKPDAVELPDLSTRILQTEWLDLEFAAGIDSAESTQAALAATVEAASAVCDSKPAPQTCRVMRLALDWSAGSGAVARVQIGWLVPLPDGMVPAPPLDPAPKG